jgi:glycolate oxidase FAD binding subunit
VTASAPVSAPKTREELAAIVAAAARDGRPVTPGTLSIRGLDRIVAHEPGDLTLTAECGITIAAIQELLAGHRQFVALDPPDPHRTLGDVLVSGRDGPLSARFGSVRDQVLGLTVVNGDGRITHCGGRVVKNVTGYDLCRLYTGSGGGLGILVEATVRLRPVPERCRRLDFAYPDESFAFERSWELRARVPEIASIQIAHGSEGGVVASAIVAGLEAFVAAAAGEIASVMGTPESDAPCDVRSFRVAWPIANLDRVTIAAPPSAWRELSAALARQFSIAVGFVHDVLRGVRETWVPSDRPPFPRERELDALLAKYGATLDCPDDPGFQATLPARFPSQVPGGIELMRSLKRALDPAGILNPGGTVYG